MVTIGEAKCHIDNFKSLNKNDFKFIGHAIDKREIRLYENSFSPNDLKNNYVVYIVQLKKGIYIGSTNNPYRRFLEHLTRRDGILYKHLTKENCIYISICNIFETQKEARDFESDMIKALQYLPAYNLLNKHI